MEVNDATRFSARVDLLTAAQYIEKAIHARNLKQVSHSLRRARTNIAYARDHLDAVNAEEYAGHADDLISELDKIIKESDSRENKLQEFQKDIHAYQGLLGALYQELSLNPQ